MLRDNPIQRSIHGIQRTLSTPKDQVFESWLCSRTENSSQEFPSPHSDPRQRLFSKDGIPIFFFAKCFSGYELKLPEIIWWHGPLSKIFRASLKDDVPVLGRPKERIAHTCNLYNKNVDNELPL